MYVNNEAKYSIMDDRPTNGMYTGIMLENSQQAGRRAQWIATIQSEWSYTGMYELSLLILKAIVRSIFIQSQSGQDDKGDGEQTVHTR